MWNKKAYCKGLFCRRSDRRFKSVYSSKYMCGLCAMPIGKNNKGKNIYCTIDEYVNPKYIVNWKNINKDFDEMLNKLNIKNEKTITTQKDVHKD